MLESFDVVKYGAKKLVATACQDCNKKSWAKFFENFQGDFNES